LNDDEVDALIAGLHTKRPLPTLPVPAAPAVAPWYRRRWVGGLALAAGLLLSVVGVQQLREDRVTARGDGPLAPTLSLDLSVARSGETVRLGDGMSVAVGEAIYFRVSAVPDAPVVLSVETPTGREAITSLTAGAEAEVLQSEQGYVGYVPDAPGPHTFRLVAEGAELSVAVTARPKK